MSANLNAMLNFDAVECPFCSEEYIDCVELKRHLFGGHCECWNQTDVRCVDKDCVGYGQRRASTCGCSADATKRPL